MFWGWRGGCYLKNMIGEGLTNNKAFEQRPGGRERGSHGRM